MKPDATSVMSIGSGRTLRAMLPNEAVIRSLLDDEADNWS
jgi:hypothetical protein